MGAAEAATETGADMPSNLPPELAEALTRKANAEAKIAEANAEQVKMQLDNIMASNDRNRVLVLSGPILETEEACAILMRWGRRDPGKDITIYMNTPGGSVFDGNALVACIRALRKAGHKVTIYGAGTVLSYGAVLLQAADVRILDKDVVFMLHSLNAPHITGQLESITDTTKMLEAVQDRLLEVMAERATISKTKIKQLTRRKDLYLSAQEAHKYGFCDRVE
jgi:ATP-dependent Clp protease protease subunit